MIAAAMVGLALMGAPAIDASALRTHLDEVVPAQLSKSGVPGAVVTVVQGSRVLVAAGWGWADIDGARPMDAHTLVRVASISKTFTASAIAKLEAEGELDIDVDVQRYLKRVRIPKRFDEPITLRHLLSHTAGFINYNPGRITTVPIEEDLASFLRDSMPPQMFAPGQGVLYSNHGNALAGLVIEDVTGQPFARWVQAQLLDPLAMHDSGYTLDDRAAALLATSYVRVGDDLVAQDYLHFRTVPASGLMSSAHDMAHWLVMHLQDGQFEGRTVLPREAIMRMREPSGVVHRAIPGHHYAFGFGHTAGHPTRSHGGSVPAFLSRIVLFDELGVGVFVAQNAFGDSIAEPIVESIAQAFLPAPPPAPPILAMGDGRPPDPEALLGPYQRLSKADTAAFTRPRALLFEPPLRVDLDDDGFLRIDGDRFVHTGDLVFARAHKVGPPELVALMRSSDGTMWLHRGTTSAYARPGHASPWLHVPAWTLSLLALVAIAIAPIVRPRARPLGRARLGLTFAAALGLAAVLMPHLYAAWIDRGQPIYLQPLRFGIPIWIPILRALRWPALAVAALVWIRSRRDPSLRRASRITTLAILGTLLLELYFATPAPGLLPP